MNWTNVLGIFAAVLLGALMVRNERIYVIRRAFINDNPLFPVAYDLLPGYDAMLFELRYWHLWTEKQWRQWSVLRTTTGQQP